MKKSRYTESQVVRILEEGTAGNQSIVEICRSHGISEATYYAWRRRYGGLQVSEVRHLRHLEQENAQLKHLLAERELENHALRTLATKNCWTLPANARGRKYS